MLDHIDQLLNKFTMYRLTLYSMFLILGGAVFLSSYSILHYNPFAIIFSTAFFLFFCAVANDIFAWGFNVPSNTESTYITALILTALVTPPTGVVDTRYFTLALWTAVWAVASKYIFAYKKRHIFNPAAFAIVLTSLTIGLSATWWIGTPAMLPFVLLAGLALVRRIRRFDLVLSFMAVSLIVTVAPALLYQGDIVTRIIHTLGTSPMFFFAFIMLTEPLTTPPTSTLRMVYGGVVGFLFAPWSIGPLYTTPEIALLVGNLGSYFVSAKDNLLLKLKRIEALTSDSCEFIFESPSKLRYKPGQYMEWMLPHENPDNRGMRRYLTISSSPTEDELAIGVKFSVPGSTYKQNLLAMQPGDTITASHLVGDFVLPLNPKQKLAFLAGGIGITPFKSMMKYLVDTNEKRDISILYASKNAVDIAYKKFFDDASAKLGFRLQYLLSENNETIDKNSIQQQIPDWQDRTFYIAGPMQMVIALDKVLKEMGVKDSNIKKDFFPGF